LHLQKEAHNTKQPVLTERNSDISIFKELDLQNFDTKKYQKW